MTGLLLLLDFSDAEYDLPSFLLQKKIKNDFALFKISFFFFDVTKVVITSKRSTTNVESLPAASVNFGIGIPIY